MSYEYDPENSGINVKKVTGPLDRMVTSVGWRLLCWFLPLKFALTRTPASGTKSLKSFDPGMVARAYQRIQPKHSSKIPLGDGEMRWELSRHLAEVQMQALIATIARNDKKSMRLTDHFMYHKFYGQFRLQSMIGTSASPKSGLYFWNHAVEEITQGFARTMDFILRGGGCMKKNTVKRIAMFHQNFGLSEDLVLIAARFMRDSMANISDEADMETYDEIFLTDLATVGLLEGSQVGYLDNQPTRPDVH